MIRSLWTGVNGVVGHQTYLDVIGNNVANVNTVGFRRSSPVFSDLLSDLMRGATGPQGNVGGVSPMQVGLGSIVTAIDVSQAAGTLSLTDSPTDIAISGSGFFVVRNEQGQFYTRAGNFVADGEGYLVQSGTGNYLMGTRIGDGSVPGTPGGLEPVKIPVPSETGDSEYTLPPKATGGILYACNLDAGMALGDSHATETTVYDNLGNVHQIRVTWSKATEIAPDGTETWKLNRWTWKAELLDEDPPVEVGSGEIGFSGASDPATGVVAGDIIRDGSEIVAINVPYSPVPDPNNPGQTVTPEAGEITLDFGGGGDPLAGITQFGSPSTTRSVKQDGYPMGYRQGVVVTADGVLNVVYSNNMVKPTYRIPLAFFRNPMGLKSEGDVLFSVTANSGDLNLLFPGAENTGKLMGGALEGSNGDLADSFSDLIISQRSFQANARVITTSDAFLKESISMKK